MGCGASSERIRELDLEVERLRTEKRDEDAVVVARKPTWELGVTLGFLDKFLQELDSGFSRFFNGLGFLNRNFTTDDLVEKFIKPAVKEKQCRYVDLIPSECVKPPTVFVSHRWKGAFRHLVERLFKQFNYHNDPSAREISVWIDVFAVNQNQNEETKRDIDGFERVIQQTSITAFNLDDKGDALRRVWCLFEVWKTFSHRGVDSLVVMSQGIAALNLREIFYKVDVAKAEAFEQADKVRILGNIKDEFDFQDFNMTVREALVESTARQMERLAQGGEGVDAEEQFDALNQRQEILRATGKSADAVPYAQKMLEIAEREKKVRWIYSSLYNLVVLYVDNERFDDARPLIDRCVKLKGFNPVKLIHEQDTSMEILGIAFLHYGFLGDKKNALLAYTKRIERLLAAAERLSHIAGYGHYDDPSKNLSQNLSQDLSAVSSFALLLFLLASMYQKLGRFEDALPLFERSLAMRDRVHREEHPHVATSLNKLATVYRDMDRYEDALPLFERSLAIHEKVYGEEHPKVAESLTNLALLYKNMNRFEDALPLVERSLAIFEKVHGEEHSDVALGLNNLATLYRDMERYKDALPLYERSLAIFEKLEDMERNNDALSLCTLDEQRRLARYMKLEKPERHSYVAIPLSNSGHLYCKMERYNEAKALLERALAINEKVLGKEHSRTKQTIGWLNEVLSKM